MAAGHLIKQMKTRPIRTIRVIAFANEEQGLWGGRVYAESQKDKIGRHQMVMESDSGPGIIYAFGGSWGTEAETAVKQMYDVIAPLGIAYTPQHGNAESEMELMQGSGAAAAAFAHDASR
jgi:Zn-dependent M28 family amino/carboxypeptidase